MFCGIEQYLMGWKGNDRGKGNCHYSKQKRNQEVWKGCKQMFGNTRETDSMKYGYDVLYILRLLPFSVSTSPSTYPNSHCGAIEHIEKTTATQALTTRQHNQRIQAEANHHIRPVTLDINRYRCKPITFCLSVSFTSFSSPSLLSY